MTRAPLLVCAAIAVAAVVVAAGCPKPEPIYDDEIGVQAEPAEVGSLAGTFALKALNATQVSVPFEPEEEPVGGGVNYRLVTREWSYDEQLYLQESALCGGYNFEVLGVTTSVPQATYQLVPKSTRERVVVDHDRGTYESTGHIQLWAIELDDPYDDAFPASVEEAQSAAFRDRIFDMEDDGDPGLTLYVSGLVEGEVYAVQRKQVDLDGVIRGPDEALGLAQNSFESLMIGNDNELLDSASQGSAEPHPDPQLSWFQEVRIPDGSDCEHVLGAEERGELSVRRPF